MGKTPVRHFAPTRGAGYGLQDRHDRATRSAAGRWGILFQQGALFSSLTVRQNIQFPLRENLVLSDALMDEIATAKLEMVGLKAEDGDKFPSELSGGMASGRSASITLQSRTTRWPAPRVRDGCTAISRAIRMTEGKP